jgi:hypothetical protein
MILNAIFSVLTMVTPMSECSQQLLKGKANQERRRGGEYIEYYHKTPNSLIINLMTFRSRSKTLNGSPEHKSK